MKKVLKKIIVNYGGLIFLYLAVIIATFSLLADYKMAESQNGKSDLITNTELKI